MEKTNFLDWMLLGIRLFIGTTFLLHGGQKIVGLLGYACFNNSNISCGGLFYAAPFIEIFGGGLILAGIIIELGTLLIIPGMILFLFMANIDANPLFTQINMKLLLNLMMLTVVISICGPGKWALWDPGKSMRNKFLKAED